MYYRSVVDSVVLTKEASSTIVMAYHYDIVANRYTVTDNRSEEVMTFHELNSIAESFKNTNIILFLVTFNHCFKPSTKYKLIDNERYKYMLNDSNIFHLDLLLHVDLFRTKLSQYPPRRAKEIFSVFKEHVMPDLMGNYKKCLEAVRTYTSDPSKTLAFDSFVYGNSVSRLDHILDSVDIVPNNVHFDVEGGNIDMPLPGRYEQVHMYDYNNYYANIVIMFNISFETMLLSEQPTANLTRPRNKSRSRTIQTTVVSFDKSSVGILPLLMSTSKSFANSLIGASNSKGSKYCNSNILAAVTAIGRKYHDRMSQDIPRDVRLLYGHTDSKIFDKQVVVQTPLPFKHTELKVLWIYNKITYLAITASDDVIIKGLPTSRMTYRGVEYAKQLIRQMLSGKSIAEITTMVMNEPDPYKFLQQDVYGVLYDNNVPYKNGNVSIEQKKQFLLSIVREPKYTLTP